MAKIIAVAQEKGGNCKSTTSVNMTILLNQKGYKTLLIDADQQANSSDTFHAEYEGVNTLYDCIIDGTDPNACIQHTEIGDIIAGDPLLREAKEKLQSLGLTGVMAFKNALSKIEGYDYIIIDCPPDTSTYLQSIFVAADEIIVPVLASRYSLMGIDKLVETLNAVKILNQNLKITGFLLCRFNGRTNADKDVLVSLFDIANNLETKIFNSYVRESVAVRSAELSRLPVTINEPKSNPALDYMSFVEEYLGEEC